MKNTKQVTNSCVAHSLQSATNIFEHKQCLSTFWTTKTGWEMIFRLNR